MLQHGSHCSVLSITSALREARQITRFFLSQSRSSWIGYRTAFPIFTKGGPTRIARQLRRVPTLISPRYRWETSSAVKNSRSSIPIPPDHARTRSEWTSRVFFGRFSRPMSAKHGVSNFAGAGVDLPKLDHVCPVMDWTETSLISIGCWCVRAICVRQDIKYGHTR